MAPAPNVPGRSAVEWPFVVPFRNTNNGEGRVYVVIDDVDAAVVMQDRLKRVGVGDAKLGHCVPRDDQPIGPNVGVDRARTRGIQVDEKRGDPGWTPDMPRRVTGGAGAIPGPERDVAIRVHPDASVGCAQKRKSCGERDFGRVIVAETQVGTESHVERNR
jgi:hypothetical protein